MPTYFNAATNTVKVPEKKWFFLIVKDRLIYMTH